MVFGKCREGDDAERLIRNLLLIGATLFDVLKYGETPRFTRPVETLGEVCGRIGAKNWPIFVFLAGGVVVAITGALLRNEDAGAGRT
mmetsp:Transcript_24327/g.30942  ORF Transcript_24327/g.30942 Transcript_24327/m.30942 type:complete len:87 (+) Transcript_24327:350-610(+)